MNNFVSHHDYYLQFVNDSVKNLVINCIGLERIKKSIDPHFNDIPLKLWDNLECSIRNIVGDSIRKLNNSVSLSDCICVAKTAAKLIKNGV